MADWLANMGQGLNSSLKALWEAPGTLWRGNPASEREARERRVWPQPVPAAAAAADVVVNAVPASAVAPAPPAPDPLAVANQNTKRAIADLLTGQRDRLEAARQKNPYTQQGAYYDTQMQKATLGGLAHGRGLIRNLISRGKYGTGIGDAQVDRADTDLAAGLMQLKGNLGAQEANYDLGIVDRLTANDAARVAAEGGYFDRAFDIAKFGEGQRQFNVTTEQQAKQFAERMGYQWEALRAEQKAAFIQAIASIFGEAGRAVLPGFAKKQGWIA